MTQTQTLSEEMRECIETCLDCHSSCQETMSHCLMMGGAHAGAEHQRILADCAQACVTSADFMLRMSGWHTRICAICADLCATCAESCVRVGPGDEVMMACAEQCRRCEESCRMMAGAAAARRSGSAAESYIESE